MAQLPKNYVLPSFIPLIGILFIALTPVVIVSQIITTNLYAQSSIERRYSDEQDLKKDTLEAPILSVYLNDKVPDQHELNYHNFQQGFTATTFRSFIIDPFLPEKDGLNLSGFLSFERNGLQFRAYETPMSNLNRQEDVDQKRGYHSFTPNIHIGYQKRLLTSEIFLNFFDLSFPEMSLKIFHESTLAGTSPQRNQPVPLSSYVEVLRCSPDIRIM